MADSAVPPVAASPLLCGACRSELGLAARRYEDRGTRYAQCDVCGFYIWCGSDPVVLPIESLTEHLEDGPEIEAALLSAEGTASVREAARRLAMATVADVRSSAVAAPHLLDATLWKLMDERERLMAANREKKQLQGANVSVLTRVIDLLMAIVLEERAPELAPRERDAAAVQSFSSAFRREAADAVELLLRLRDVRLGFDTPRVEQRNLVLDPAEARGRIWEWQINRNEILQHAMGYATPALDEPFSRALLAAQKVVWGISLNDAGAEVQRMLNTSACPPILQGGTLCAMEVESCSEPLRRVIDAHTLTRQRIEEFEAPLFWDLGEPAQAPCAPADTLLKPATQNWSAYYPLMNAAREGSGRWCVVPWQMFRTVIDIVGTYKGQLLERLYNQARAKEGKKSKVAAQLATLRQDANRAFESMAAQVGRQCGWRAASAVSQIDGRRLKAGDIDVILAQVDDCRLTVILGEVKDLDLSFRTPEARERFQKKVDHAYAQLRAKAQEIRPRVRELLRTLFDLDASAYSRARLVSIVVTSDYLPPYLFHEFPGVPIDTLPLMFHCLTKDPVRAKALYGRGFSELW